MTPLGVVAPSGGKADCLAGEQPRSEPTRPRQPTRVRVKRAVLPGRKAGVAGAAGPGTGRRDRIAQAGVAMPRNCQEPRQKPGGPQRSNDAHGGDNCYVAAPVADQLSAAAAHGRAPEQAASSHRRRCRRRNRSPTRERGRTGQGRRSAGSVQPRHPSKWPHPSGIDWVCCSEGSIRPTTTTASTAAAGRLPRPHRSGPRARRRPGRGKGGRGAGSLE